MSSGLGALTGYGKAAIPFLVVLGACVVGVVVLLRRRARFAGFHLPEAASYVFGNLGPEQRRRITFPGVVEMLEAEQAFAEDEPDADDDRLVAFLRERAGEAGLPVGEDDARDVVRLQYDYAHRKGLL